MPDYSYQEDGIAWLRALPEGRGLLADEPGLGKSRQLLMAAEGRTLVVAPAMVLDGGVWDTEVTKWRPDLDVTTAPYSMLNARQKTGTNASATRPTDDLRPEFRGRWDTVILDESHYIKGRSTSWTKAVAKLDTDRLYCATGTPIPNWAHELFTTLRLLHPAEARQGGRYGSYWRWVAEWFEVGATRHSPMAVGEPLDDSPEGWGRFHRQNLDGRFLQRKRDDVLSDLPPLTVQTVRLRMKPKQTKLYRELKRDYVAWTEGGDEVVAWSSGGLHTKLAKLCTGVEVEVPGHKPCSAKLDALAERLRDQARPSMVTAQFRSTVRQAARRAKEVGRSPVVIDGSTPGSQRREALLGYESGRYDVLCATIETVSEGLTLTHADTVHRLERSYRPHKNEQVIRRVHRIGQERPVTVIDYVSAGTVDEQMSRLLEEKTAHQIRALTAGEYASML